MKQFLRSILIGLFLTTPVYGEVYPVADLGCGLVDTVPGHLIPDCAVTSLSNFHVNPYSRSLEQRRGSSRKNSSQLPGKKAVDIFTYVQNDGDEYIVAISSKTYAYSSDNGATFTTLTSTATDGALNDATNFPADSKIYGVSQNDGGWSFDGTVYVNISAVPAGKYIQTYQNRLWVANTSANPYRLFFSGLLTPTSWTTATDYIDFPGPITGIGMPYDGGLPVYLDGETWMVRGTAPTNFDVRQISNVVGCAHNRTIQNFNLKGAEYQIFLSKGENQTQNNLYALDGTQVAPIGNNILNTLSGIAIGNSSQRSQSWDSQLDFNAGTFDMTNSTRTPGSVQLGLLIDDFTDGDFTSNPAWTQFDNDGGSTLNDWTVTGGQKQYINADSNISMSYTVLTSTVVGSWEAKFTASDLNGWPRWNFMAVTTGTASSHFDFGYQFERAASDYDLARNGAGSSGAILDTETLSFTPGQQYTIRINRTAAGLITVYRDNVQILQATDTTYSSSTVMGITASCPDVGDTNKFDDFYFAQSTGSYTSQIMEADSNFSQWGNFDADFTLNGGAITFYVRTAATSGDVPSASWNAVSSGAQAASTSHRFLQWKAEFSGSGDPLENSPLVNRVTINWTSSSGAGQALASGVFNGEYWLSYTGPSESRNQSIIVMNREGAFAPFDGLNAYSLTVERGRLFAGDSSTDTVNGGYVWEYETGTTDNGTAVTAVATLKNQQFGHNDHEKNLGLVYFNYAVDIGTFTASMVENFSEYTTDYNVPFSSGTSYNRWKLELNQQTTGRNFALRFTNTYSGTRLKIFPPIIYHFDKVRLIPQ